MEEYMRVLLFQVEFKSLQGNNGITWRPIIAPLCESVFHVTLIAVLVIRQSQLIKLMNFQ